MDSSSEDSSSDPHAFDDKKPENPADSAAEAQNGEGSTSASKDLTPVEPGKPPQGESAKPEHSPTPIPSSALVILPPAKKKNFDDTFTAERPAGAAPAPRASWRTYGVRAAAILLFAGGAYAAGSYYLAAPGTHEGVHQHLATLGSPAAPAAAAPHVQAATGNSDSGSELVELRHETKTLRGEIQNLRSRLASLQSQTPEEIRALKKSLEAERAQSKSVIGQLEARLNRVQREEAARVVSAKAHASHLDAKAIQATLDKAQRTEESNAQMATGTISGAEAHGSRPRQLALASAETPHHGPQMLTDWVVRDVYRGIALVEGPQGAVEVMPGDVLPGAGTVRAIERRGDGWIVVTSRGYVDYDHD